jgi:hypothetical protein
MSWLEVVDPSVAIPKSMKYGTRLLFGDELLEILLDKDFESSS